MGRALTSAQWRRMRPDERLRALDELVTAAMSPPNGEMHVIEREIEAFEHRYELRTERMIEAVRAGRLAETADVSAWLMLVHRRDLFAANAAKTP